MKALGAVAAVLCTFFWSVAAGAAPVASAATAGAPVAASPAAPVVVDPWAEQPWDQRRALPNDSRPPKRREPLHIIFLNRT